MLSMSPVPLSVFESYCFMKSTYTHVKMSTSTNQTKSMHLGVHGGADNLYQASGDHNDAVHHNYYQQVAANQIFSLVEVNQVRVLTLIILQQ